MNRKRIKALPTIEVRIQPNMDGTDLIWSISASDGTRASGFAQCHADAMRDAAAFAEAMAQPRLGGRSVLVKPALRVVS